MKNISTGIFGAALATFFLTFASFSCAGETVTDLTGIALATGTKVTQPRLFGPPETIAVPGNPYAVVALVSASIGLVLGIARGKVSHLLATIVGMAGAASLLRLKSTVTEETLRQGEGFLGVHFTGAYWMAFFLFLAAATINLIAFGRRWPAADVGSTDPVAPAVENVAIGTNPTTGPDPLP